MKTTLLLLVMALCSISLQAQNPTVKFYLENGNVKSYDIADIENIGFIKGNGNLVLIVHYQDSLTKYHLTFEIDSIVFNDNMNQDMYMQVYTLDTINSYLFSELDSLVLIPTDSIFESGISQEVSAELDTITFRDYKISDALLSSGEKVLEYLQLHDSTYLKEHPELLLYPLGMGLQYFEFVSQVGIATCKNTVLQTDS